MTIYDSGSQSTFLFHISGLPLPTAVVRFYAKEAISRTFTATVTLATETEIDHPADIVGREAVLTILTILNESDSADGGADTNRYFHGIVRQIEQTGLNGRYHIYKVMLAPAFWRLSLRKNCRIFQETTSQDIIQSLLEENSILSDQYRFALTNKDRPRGFCVQYRESDLEFISRLLQEEGIFYFFEHYPDRHVIVFGDHPVIHVPIKGPRQIRFNENSGLVAEEESIHSFGHSERINPDSFVYKNFYFKKPSLDLSSRQQEESEPAFEVYDYPGPYVSLERGNYLSKARLEEQTAMRIRAEVQSHSCRITPGYIFSLTCHPLQHLNTDYLIVSVTHSGEQSQSLHELTERGFQYQNGFSVIPSSTPFRPPGTARKPVVQGLQTALVVGPQSEEIYTDRYGRVKVQFHWDREGRNNERSSCWLRCARGWAGGGWGMVFTPRVGDEVLVDFLEGDPDRPIIVGSVYNEANLPLYELPANKTISTIKTKSYPGGSGFNELRFEDRRGAEEIYLHGEKDWSIGIENDKNQAIGHDETLRVGNNREKHVGVDQRVTVGSNHSEGVGANQSISIGRNKSETVGLNSAENVGLAKELTIGGLYQVTVGGAMNETVAGAKAEEVGVSKSLLVGTKMSEKVMGNRSISVGRDFSTTVGKTSLLRAKSIVFEADDEIVLKTGTCLIALKSDGGIVINGGTIQTKGSGDVIIKGAKILEN